MNKNVLKSIGAILVGFIAGAILSVLTDLLLEKTGFMRMEPFNYNSWWIIIIVILYRCIYNVLGCYIAATLAPNRPMRHALILGFIGLAITIAGTIAMWDKPPHWYPIALILLTLPSAWLGGKLKIKFK
jgi:hypothetical protein